MYRPSAYAESILVAASDAPARLKRLADPYVCDGTADHVQINQAITDSALDGSPTRYGSVILTSGKFVLTQPILIPGRGFSLRGQGFSTQLYVASGGGFTDTGEGSEKALIMLAPTAAGRNACNVLISDMYLNCSDGGSTVSGIWLDHTAGGLTGPTSASVYGEPTVGTDSASMTQHTISHIRMRGVEYGVGILGGGGDLVFDVRMNQVNKSAYYTDPTNVGTMFDQCHAITGDANAVGFNINGDGAIMVGCKPAYFDETGGKGYSIVGDGCRIEGCEAQDNTTGIVVTGSDLRITGMTIETEKNTTNGVPGAVGMDITGATRVNATGLSIHARNSGTYYIGLHLPTDGGDHRVDAYIIPRIGSTAASVTYQVVEGTGGSSAVVTAASMIPDGMFNLEMPGTATIVTVS